MINKFYKQYLAIHSTFALIIPGMIINVMYES